jgi:copper chaperone CopZ
MKLTQTILILLVTVISYGADPATTYTYHGEVAGVVCSACSSKVKTAISKLEGVKSVTITLPEQGGTPKLEVVSSSPNLTKEEANKSLGEAAKMYEIRTLKRDTK